MKLQVIGVNHSTADIALRERFAFAPEMLSTSLLRAMDAMCESLNEVAILSTCNRTEVIVAGEVTKTELLTWLAADKHLEVGLVEPHIYAFHEEQAFRHLVCVASGLDSMVLGEPQIFGQMKSAYAVARETGTVSLVLERVFQSVFTIAKRVRSDTAIGENPVSVAFAAVSLAQRIYADLSSVSVLLIGAGETIDLVAKHLIDAGVKNIVVANRTLERASQVASQYGAHAVLLAEVPEVLQSSDIVISSTGSQLPILGKGAVETALTKRKRRPMFMVDLAVPRDIESEAADLDDVYLYTVDDLSDIVDQNQRLRKAEADKASEIITQGVEDFKHKQRARGATDLVVSYRQAMEYLRQQELQKFLQLLNSFDMKSGLDKKDLEKVLDDLSQSLVNKIMHSPSVMMRKAAGEGKSELLDIYKEFLGVDDPD